MKSNRQARHILGLNYKLSNQRKVVIEGDSETQVTHHRQKTPRWQVSSSKRS